MIRKWPQPQKALFHPGSVPKLSPYPKSQYVKPPKMTSTAFLTIMLTSFLLVTDPLSSRPKPGEKRILVISWWRHQVETFPALLALFVGNSPVTGEFPPQRPVTRSFDVLFDLRLNKWWVHNREAGDFRRHRSHYDTGGFPSERPATGLWCFLWSAPERTIDYYYRHARYLRYHGARCNEMIPH